MILRNISFQNDLPIEEDHYHTISAASPRLFGRIVQSFAAMESGEEPPEPFALLDNDKAVNPSRYLFVVTDPFHAEINNRKNLSALYSETERLLVSNQELYTEWLGHILSAAEILESVTAQFAADTVITEELSVSAYAKAAGLAFDIQPDAEIHQKLYGLMDILAEFSPERILVLCNIIPYLSEASWRELMKYACYTKIKLLDIERSLFDPPGAQEIRWQITEDYDDQIIRG